MNSKLIKLLFVVALFFQAITTVTAQELNLNDPLPVNEKIKKGVLPNGLTYYIYSTDVTKNAASYYIIQNVGSVLENDNQSGLAHFLEHMAFNGTEHFEGKGILNTLQKYGAVFGKDINAYTSFDETVYNLNNIPTKDGLVDTCLLILKDWSNYLLLTEEEIDAERGVIKEEWRTRQSGQMRILQKSLPVMFGNSKYAERLPIGKMDIVENFEYKALRDFYHDWYRTDLQAIAVIGDIDVNEVEAKIKESFSEIPAVKNPVERYSVTIDDNEEMLYEIAMDEEVTTSNISFNINHTKSIKDQTVADLKKSLIHTMAFSMLSARLDEIKQNPEATFVYAGASYGSLVRLKNQFSVRVYPKPNMQQQAFKDVLTEVYRAVKFGFTAAEVERTIAELKNNYETLISKEDDISHARIARTIQNDYLVNETMTDVAKEYELAKSIFNTISTETIHEAFKKLYTPTNRALLVTGVEGNKNLTKEEGLAIINGVENDATITAYQDAFSGKTLISGVTIKPGSIVEKSQNAKIGATTFKLSNGAVVHYKFANKNKNEVSLRATSYGGTSLLTDDMLPSANLIGGLIQFSGLGDFSMTELPKVLAGKSASTSISLGSFTEGISGRSTTKDVETMLQMLYLNFEKPRFDENGYKVLMENINNYLIRRSENIGEKMNDSITTTLYGENHPKKRLFNKEFAEDISFEKMKSIYLERFSNASDFEFFIVGDVDEATLKPLLEKYIASISSTETKENWKDNSSNWVTNNIDKDIFLKMEDPKASVRILYKNEIPYNLENKIIADALGDILQLRFTETLREEEGGTYGASARSYVEKRPIEQGIIQVSFDCNPDKADKLTAIVHTEINKLAEGNINQVDLDKTLTNFLKEREQAKDYNKYDMSLLLNFYREGYNMNNPDNYENIINSITAKDIQKLAKEMLKNAKSYEIVFKPVAQTPLSKNVSKNDVIQKYIDAVGGAKISEVNTIYTKATAAIQGMELIMESKTMAPYKQLVTISGMGMVLSKQVFDGTTGYMEQQGQRSELRESQITDFKETKVPFAELQHLTDDAVTLEGIVDINGKDAYHIKISEKLSKYYDVETGFKVKDLSKMEGMGQLIEQSTYYGDYKEVSGVKVPFTFKLAIGAQTYEFNANEIKINESVTEEDFK